MSEVDTQPVNTNTDMNVNEVDTNLQENASAPAPEAPEATGPEVPEAPEATVPEAPPAAEADAPDDDAESHHDRVMHLVNGKRPFVEACNQYTIMMRKKINGAMQFLSRNSDATHTNIRIAAEQEVVVRCDNGSEKRYSFDVVHYGPKIRGYWRNRDKTIWAKCRISPPFRRLQFEVMRMGYYLRDESDPDKGHRLVIRLYTAKPDRPLYLWHGYGTIPQLGRVAGETGETAAPGADAPRRVVRPTRPRGAWAAAAARALDPAIVPPADPAIVPPADPASPPVAPPPPPPSPASEATATAAAESSS